MDDSERIVAFDAGGTHTRAGLYDSGGKLLAEADGPSANVVECGVSECTARLSAMLNGLVGGRDPARYTLYAGVAGAGNDALRSAIAEGLKATDGVANALVSDDVWPMMAANAGTGPGILVIAGTGAVVQAQSGDGRHLRLGGRGPVLGDRGGAYAIGAEGLYAAARVVDGLDDSSPLPNALAEGAGVAAFEALVAWSRSAGKADIAGLAPTVLTCAEDGDTLARRVVMRQAEYLVELVVAAGRRLDLPPTTRVFSHGGLFERSELYRTAFTESASAHGWSVTPVSHAGHEAVCRWGREVGRA